VSVTLGRLEFLNLLQIRADTRHMRSDRKTSPKRRSPIVKILGGALLAGTALTSTVVLGGSPAGELGTGASLQTLEGASRSAPLPTPDSIADSSLAPGSDPGSDTTPEPDSTFDPANDGVIDVPFEPDAPLTPGATVEPGISPTSGGDSLVPDPDLEVTEVAGDYEVTDHLRKNWPIPASTAHLPNGNFRAICEFSHFAYDDPIVAPGQPGVSHLHMYFGNTGADAYSTYESLRSTGDSTCQGGPLNRSAYWAPAVIDTAGRALAPDFISVYYKGRGWGTDGSRVDVVNMPPGLRMIAGADPSDPDASSRHQWNCENRTLRSPTIPTCDPGMRVGVLLHFPTCWDGRLDAPDHRSHVVYPLEHEVTGQPLCPTSHPQSLPEFTLGVWFAPSSDSADWHLSSDRVPGQETYPNGSTFHSDWFGAWDQAIQKDWIDNCINGELDCSWGDLGNGTALSVNPEYTGPNRLAPPPLPASVARAALAQASESGVSALTCVLYGGGET